MIIYSRFNPIHHSIQIDPDPRIDQHTIDKQVRRMGLKRFDEGWLERRLQLFAAYTYPSVCAQTNQGFDFVGIVHKDSPMWFIEALDQFPNMSVSLVEVDIEAAVRGVPSINVDSDDAISRDFVAEAKKTGEGHTMFYRGMKHRTTTGAWFAISYEDNHFNIVRHSELTVLDFNHRWNTIPPTVIRHDHPMWLEVVHDDNLVNRLRRPRDSEDLSREDALRYFEIR